MGSEIILRIGLIKALRNASITARMPMESVEFSPRMASPGTSQTAAATATAVMSQTTIILIPTPCLWPWRACPLVVRPNHTIESVGTRPAPCVTMRK